MKNFTLGLLFVLGFFSLNAQTIFYEDFQGGIPSNFTLINADGNTPASAVSFVNQAWVAYPDFNDPTDTAAMSTSWYNPASSSNDWMITPKITLSTGNFLIWRGWAPDQSYADGYEVKISTTDSAMASFTTNLAVISAEGDPWVWHAVDLSAYNNQSVFIAFRNNSNDKYLLLIDDITVRTVDSFDIAGVSCSMQSPIGMNNAPFDVTGLISNNGSQNITSFDLNYSVDGGTTVTAAVSSVNIAPFATYSFTHGTQWNPSTTGNHVIKIWASNINGHADANMSNDTITKTISVAAQSSQRIPLYEEFTSSTCAPCASANAAFTPVLNANVGKYALVKYQMDWPGNGDPYFTAEGGDRQTLYGVNAVPDLYVDGANFGGPGSFSTSDVNAAYAIPSFTNLSANMVVNANHSVDITVTINPLTDFPTTARLFTAIIEKKTVNNTASNGETEFHNVMKKMVPSSAGKAVTLTSGNQVIETLSHTFVGNYRLPANANSPINHSTEHSVEEFSDLTAIVWIQDVTSLTVYQAAEATVTMGIEDQEQATIHAIFPNPAYDNATLRYSLKNSAHVSYTLVNTLGQTVLTTDMGQQNAGTHNQNINVSTLAKGIYMLTLQVGNKTYTKKFNVK